MKKILIVVDYQNDFVAENGVLSIPKANSIHKNIQKLIDNKIYEQIIYTFDTHTEIEYETSKEKEIFPDIHCDFNSNGWDLFKIKPRNNIEFNEKIRYFKSSQELFSVISIKEEIFFTKNVFDIWDGNKDFVEFIKENFKTNEVEIDVCGVATNYCVFSAVMGFRNLNYKVNVISNSVMAIENLPDGSIDESFINNMIIMKNNNVNFIR